jgi:hypothetical protein
VRDGKVVRISVDAVSPFQVYDRVSWYKSTAWLQPTLIASVLILLIATLSLPFGWFTRRYYAAGRQLQGRERSAYLASSWLSLATLSVLGLWLFALLTLTFNPFGGWVYVLELATIVVPPLLFAASGWFLWTGINPVRSVPAVIWRIALLLSALCVVWVAVVFNLTHIGLNY